MGDFANVVIVDGVLSCGCCCSCYCGCKRYCCKRWGGVGRGGGGGGGGGGVVKGFFGNGVLAVNG